MGRKTLLAIASVTILATAAFAREPVGTNAPSPRSTDDPMVSDHAVNTKGTGANSNRSASSSAEKGAAAGHWGDPHENVNGRVPTPRGTFPAVP